MEHEKIDKRLFGFRYERVDDISCFSFLGWSLYERVGDISRVTIAGLNVYEHVGDVRSLFGIVWVRND